MNNYNQQRESLKESVPHLTEPKPIIELVDHGIDETIDEEKPQSTAN